MRCRICETWEENPKVEEELTLPELKEIIRQIANWDRKINLSFAGGEPFVRTNDLISCLRYANSLGLTTHVTTNGSYIDKKVAHSLLTSGLDFLQLSLDALDPKINDYMRGRGAFKAVIRALKILLKVKVQTNSSTKISLTTVVTNKNVDELLDLYNFVKEHNLHEIAYNPYVLDTSYVKAKSYEDDEFWIRKTALLKKLELVCNRLIELKEKEGRIGTPFLTLKLMPDYFARRKLRGICMAGFSYMYITPYGKVDVCGKGPSLSVRKHSVKAIWFSPTFAKTRLKIRKCYHPCLMICFPRISLREFFRVGG
jgi:MoaA/NifB/PqqE/SkfB family radical SAM enzyme